MARARLEVTVWAASSVAKQRHLDLEEAVMDLNKEEQFVEDVESR